MKLHTASFSLDLTARSVVDDEDWVWVRVDATVGVFSGGVETYHQLEDLRRFKDQIAVIHAKVGTPCEAALHRSTTASDQSTTVDHRLAVTLG
jgi:hypothetical protein